MSQNTTGHWAILGAGAIGSLWAMYCYKAGLPFSLIGRSPHSGCLKITADGQQWQTDVSIQTAADSLDEITALLVCTKAQDTQTAIDSVRSRLANNADVVFLQNGMALEAICHQLPEQNLFAAVTTEGVYRQSPDHLVHAGKGQTHIGSLSGQGKLEAEQLCQSLPHSYLTIKPVENISEYLWQKLAINCAINALTVKYQCRNGELLDKPEALATIREVCNEVRSVATALKITTDFSELESTVKSVLQTTAKNYSSMYQDVANQRPTEIDYLNGYLCQQAEQLQIPCPANQALIKLVKELVG